MKNNNKLATYTYDFFQNYLPQSGLSISTILGHHNTIKLLFSYAANQKKKSIAKLQIADLSPNMVINFLDYLEKERNISIQSRNSYLTYIRGFFNYLARVNEDPLIFRQCDRIVEIPFKRATQNSMMDCLEIKEKNAIVNAINRRTKDGYRDYTLFMFMYNTGARVEEVVNLPVKALKLKRPFEVKVVGKGGKERQCPLWPETVKLLRSLIKRRKLNHQADVPIFVNQRGQSFTPYHIRYLLNKYVSIASKKCPSLKQKRIYPHSAKCNYARTLTNVDMNTMLAWLGQKTSEA